jgi:hypothetical protein
VDSTTALGAFLSGFGAAASALLSARILIRRARTDCDKRVEELMKTLHEGIEIGEHHE